MSGFSLGKKTRFRVLVWLEHLSRFSGQVLFALSVSFRHLDLLDTLTRSCRLIIFYPARLCLLINSYLWLGQCLWFISAPCLDQGCWLACMCASFLPSVYDYMPNDPLAKAVFVLFSGSFAVYVSVLFSNSFCQLWLCFLVRLDPPDWFIPVSVSILCIGLFIFVYSN